MKQMDTRTVMAAPAANDAAGTERFSALGIPVDNLNMATACERVLDLVYRYPRTRRAAYVATVNVDFMVNALAVAGHAPRHPELLDILRSADLVTADGFPIVLLSRMLGTPLQGRVTGADLVPALAERAAKEGLRIYLLGGREEIARRAADMLEEANPGLEIAGVESPMVHTEGQALVNFEKDDERIIADINRSGADILLLGLGNPKQEQWFRRHRDKLKVPVSIGVGGTFEFIVGTVQRAPGWVQRANLEWLYRITQDPARLWKRYAEGLLKLALLVVPLLWLRCKELALTEVAWRGKSEPVPGWRQFSGPHRSRAASATFSPLLREAQLRRLLSEIECAPRDDTLYLMDFSQVRRVELNAMQALYELGRYFVLGRAEGVYVGMSKRLRRQLAAGRILDLFDRDTLCADSLHEPLTQQPALRGLPLRFYASDSTLVVYLHGDVDGEMLRAVGLESMLMVTMPHQSCIIDLRFAELVDSSAVAIFHRMAAAFGDGQLCFAGVQGSVRRMFKLARVPAPLRFVSDAEESRLLNAA